jgi:O-acetyl-ADP-ribose deacetylase (regulator of RNase III)
VPPADSAQAMLRAVVEHLRTEKSTLRRIVFVLYQDDAYRVFTDTLKVLAALQ